MILPILNYHGLESRTDEYAWRDEEKPYVMDTRLFSSQMDELVRGGFRTLSLAELREWATLSAPPRNDGTVMLTFDDGLKSQGGLAAPVLEKRGLKALFFIPAERVGQPGTMDWDELKILTRHGFEIGSHGLRHIPLTGLPEAQLRQEFEKSRKILEDKLGLPVKSFSIPRGFAHDTMRHVARAAGYEFLFTSSFDVNERGCDLFDLKRMVVKRGMSAKQFSDMLEGDLGFRRTWEHMKEGVRNHVPPAFYDVLAAAKRKVRLS